MDWVDSKLQIAWVSAMAAFLLPCSSVKAQELHPGPGSPEQHFRKLRPACRSHVCIVQGPGHPAADEGQQQAAAGAGSLCAQAQGVPGLHARPDDAGGSRPYAQHRSQG